MNLCDLPARQPEGQRPKIYGLLPDYPNGWIEFDHVDGMYSYCIAYNDEGEELGVCHLGALTPLIPHLDGYTFEE